MEAVNYPELQKRVYGEKIRSICAKYALRNASLIMPNHQSLLYHENYYYNPEGKKDGILYYVPHLKTRIEVVPNGYYIGKFKRDFLIKKNPNIVLSIGRTVSISDISNKGHDILIEVARRNPQLEFIMIAIKKEHLKWMNDQYHISEIGNLKIIPGICTFEMLSEYFNQANVFVQASITEGMPNTLAEAMLFECVPVGSNVNGIPDTIGDIGIIIYKRNVEELENAILKALTLDSGKQAREHIVKNFPMERREKELKRILKDRITIKSLFI
jgi:glycosyltransferase involved in cell wall biosynthesis